MRTIWSLGSDLLAPEAHGLDLLLNGHCRILYSIQMGPSAFQPSALAYLEHQHPS